MTLRAAEREAVLKADARIPALDGLRAASVMTVIVFHLFDTIFIGGFLGVDMFFVISGYIITARLLREQARTGDIALARFYVRRIKRLWPALLVFVVVATGICLATGRAYGELLSAPAASLDALYALTSTMNVARAIGHGGSSYVGHSWSLAAEEQFYLFWPVLLLVGIRSRVRDHLPLIVGVAIVLVMGWRAALVWQGAPPLRTYMGPDARADVLLWGCLLALVGTGRVPRCILRLWAIPAAILAAMVMLADLSSPLTHLGGFTLIAICSAWLVAVSVENKGLFARLLTLAPVQWAGLRSYSLFLWNPLVIGLVEETGMRQRYVVLMVLPITAVLAELSYRFVENGLRIRPSSRPHHAASSTTVVRR